MPTPLRVLIVEDTPDDAELMLLHLTAEGFQPDWTRVQTEATYLAALATSPDLILADWSLPQFSGLRALQLMRARGLDIPFVIVSGSIGEEAAIDALHQGADDYVLKDRPARLGQAARRALEDKRLRAERKRAEEALKTAAADWEATFDATTDGIYLVDSSQKIIRTNKALKRMFNLREEDAAGKLCWQVIHGTNQPIMDCPLIRAKKSRQRECLEYRFGERYFEFIVDPILDDSSVLTGAVHIVRDITERKRAEVALRESEMRYKAIVEAQEDAVCRWLPDTTLTFANARYREIFGIGDSELGGRKWTDLISTAGRETVVSFYQALVHNPTPVSYEHWEQYQDSSRHWYLWSNTPLFDGHGRCIEFQSVGRDMTERKQAEAEREQLLTQIQAQARQLAQVMRTVPEGVLLLNEAGRIVLANPRAEGDLMILAGAQVGDFLSHLGDRTLAELLSAPPKGLWHEAHAGGRSFEIIAKPIATGLSPDSWVLVLRDVTEEREARQRALQGERLAAVGQLAAGIAHDFNNILAVIALQARLALAAPDRAADVRARLATISGQAQRAADLVKQILDFGRQAVLERRPVALRPFLAEQIALLARTLPESIALELAGADDDCTVSADPTRLQQVVLNLALNARDAMPAGGRLRFALERVPALPSDLQPPADEADEAPAADEAAAWVRLTVTDTGAGISPAALARIFEPFFTTKGPGKGSGLGLSQIHGIVKQHGGEIGVSTQVGAGTTFTIYLPALAESAAAEPVVVADEAPAAAGQTILIVEDDPILRDALMDTVDLLGYRALSVANGREALAVLAQHREIGLIMSDLVMPEMGGRALLQEVKQRGVTAPMVILSGHPLDDELAGLQALGLAGWLLKPPEVEQLARLLAQTLPA